VGLQHEIARADAYIARTNRRIKKHQDLMRRSRSDQTIVITGDLVTVLAVFRSNVENRRRYLRETERPASRVP
jgi:hypothetical protein